MAGLVDQIDRALRHDPSRPLITWYDDATGERVELSVATTANWVAKTANLLRDSLDVQPGDRVVVALPLHWQTPIVQLAGWLAGACVVAVPPGGPLPQAPVAFVTEPALEAGLVPPRGIEAVALSMRPMGARLSRPRPGVQDFAEEVPGHGDHFQPGAPANGPAAVVGDQALGADEVLAASAALGLTSGTRSLVRHDPWTLDGLVASSLAPLLAGAGVVICGSLAEAALPARLESERVTAVLAPG